MAKTSYLDLGGWFPYFETLAEKYDPETALVFGVIYRYSQMALGICDAAIDTIAGHAHLSRSTTKRKLKLLSDNGYLVDMTESERHRPHYYKDTGKLKLELLAVDISDTPTDGGCLRLPNEVVHREPHKAKKSPQVVHREPDKALPDPQIEELKDIKEVNQMTGRSAEDIRKMTLQSLSRGSQNTEEIRTTVEKRFHIFPNWRTKTWGELLLFIKERPAGQTLDAFADWWYANDWRGKQGAPPTCSQIRELWPQAFKLSNLQDEKGMRINPDGSFN